MREKLAGMLGSKGDGYSFMLCLKSVTRGVPQHLFCNQSFSVILPVTRKRNQNSPISRLQMTPSLGVAVNKLTVKGVTQGDLDRLEERTKQSPVPGKDKPSHTGTGCGLVLLGRTCSPGGQNIKQEPGACVDSDDGQRHPGLYQQEHSKQT